MESNFIFYFFLKYYLNFHNKREFYRSQNNKGSPDVLEKQTVFLKAVCIITYNDRLNAKFSFYDLGDYNICSQNL